MYSIYLISNDMSGKKYFNISKKIDKKISKELILIISGEHPDKKIVSDYKEYGIESFSFKILKMCDTKKDAIKYLQSLQTDNNSIKFKNKELTFILTKNNIVESYHKIGDVASVIWKDDKPNRYKKIIGSAIKNKEVINGYLIKVIKNVR